MPALAQGGPPLITDDPGTVPKHHWEINLALTSDLDPEQSTFETPLMDINYGAGEHTQLKFEIPWLVHTEKGQSVRGGLGNSKFGVKWRLIDQEKHGVAVSTYPQITWNNPTSSVARGLEDNGMEFLMPIEIAREFHRWEVNGEIGYNFREFRRGQWIAGMAGGLKVTKKLELLAELHEMETAHPVQNDFVADAGLRFELSDHFTLLLAAGRSLPPLHQGSSRFFSYSGLQLRL